MEKEISVLQNTTRADIVYSPFPHVIIQNCLPINYYKQLEESYIKDEDLLYNSDRLAGQNIRMKFRFNDITSRKVTWPQSEVWEDFARYHTSEMFFREIVELFGPEFKTLCPHLESKLDTSLENVSVVPHEPNVKFNYSNSKKIFLDGDVGINTTSRVTSTVRGDHVDGMQKLFGGLLYFRREDDKTSGGDLDLSRWKYGVSNTVSKSTEIQKDHIEFVAKVKYEPNTAIFWVNSPGAIHGVTPRSPSKVSRRLVYFAGRVDDKTLFPQGLFPDCWPEKESLIARIYKHKIRKLLKTFKL